VLDKNNDLDLSFKLISEFHRIQVVQQLLAFGHKMDISISHSNLVNHGRLTTTNIQWSLKYRQH
jgi:hypothetical protein